MPACCPRDSPRNRPRRAGRGAAGWDRGVARSCRSRSAPIGAPHAAGRRRWPPAPAGTGASREPGPEHLRARAPQRQHGRGRWCAMSSSSCGRRRPSCRTHRSARPRGGGRDRRESASRRTGSGDSRRAQRRQAGPPTRRSDSRLQDQIGGRPLAMHRSSLRRGARDSGNTRLWTPTQDSPRAGQGHWINAPSRTPRSARGVHHVDAVRGRVATIAVTSAEGLPSAGRDSISPVIDADGADRGPGGAQMRDRVLRPTTSRARSAGSSSSRVSAARTRPEHDRPTTGPPLASWRRTVRRSPTPREIRRQAEVTPPRPAHRRTPGQARASGASIAGDRWMSITGRRKLRPPTAAGSAATASVSQARSDHTATAVVVERDHRRAAGVPPPGVRDLRSGPGSDLVHRVVHHRVRPASGLVRPVGGPAGGVLDRLAERCHDRARSGDLNRPDRRHLPQRPRHLRREPLLGHRGQLGHPRVEVDLRDAPDDRHRGVGRTGGTAVVRPWSDSGPMAWLVMSEVANWSPTTSYTGTGTTGAGRRGSTGRTDGRSRRPVPAHQQPVRRVDDAPVTVDALQLEPDPTAPRAG